MKDGRDGSVVTSLGSALQTGAATTGEVRYGATAVERRVP